MFSTAPSRSGLWTTEGLKVLGKLIRECREAQYGAIDELIEVVREKFPGSELSKKTISNIERGVGVPKWNTVALIAAIGFVRHPITKQVFTAHDFSDIAAEIINPYSAGDADGRVNTVDEQKFILSVADASYQALEECPDNSIDSPRQKTSKKGAAMYMGLNFNGNLHQVVILEPVSELKNLLKDSISVLKEWYTIQICPSTGDSCCYRHQRLTDGTRKWTESQRVPMFHCQ